MKTIYFNLKTSEGTETVDHFTKEEGQTNGQFKKYIREMLTEYHKGGQMVYTSQRKTKEYGN